MSRKPAARSRRVREVEPEPAGNAVLAWVAERTLANPAMSAGILVMALTTTAIVSNAMFLQSGSHPEPLFSSRASASVARAVEPPMPAPAPVVRDIPASQPVEVAERVPQVSYERVAATPPMPRLSPVHTASLAPTHVPAAPVVQPTPQPMPPVASAPVVDEIPQEMILLTAIQRELARLGLYAGAIDGLMGERTATAIATFQSAAGIQANGQPSVDLLKAIKHPDAPGIVQAAAARAPALANGPDAQAAELDRRERERAAMIADQQRSAEAARLAANARIAQAALNRIGYGPLPTDGSMEAETAEAIRRFELDNGMTVTGKANDELIQRLVSIGAVRPG